MNYNFPLIDFYLLKIKTILSFLDAKKENALLRSPNSCSFFIIFCSENYLIYTESFFFSFLIFLGNCNINLMTFIEASQRNQRRPFPPHLGRQAGKTGGSGRKIRGFLGSAARFHPFDGLRSPGSSGRRYS